MAEPGSTATPGFLRGTILIAGAALAIAVRPLATVMLGGSEVVVSSVDVMNLVVLLAGAFLLSRTRDRSKWRPDDPAVWVLGAFLLWVGLQALVPFVGETFDVEILTGASRFFGPLALLLGMTWVRRSGDARENWDWRRAVTVLGLALSLMIALDAIAALGEPGGFYDWKRAIQVPWIGVSNILAAYTAVALWASLTLAVRDHRWIPAPIVLALATVVTLSRAAAIGMVVAVVVVAIGRSRPRLAAVALLLATLGLTILPIALDTEAGADGLVSSAFRVRDEQFTAAFEAFGDDPVFGVGLNRFQEDVQVRTSQPSAAAVDGVIPYDHPNNAWLVALSETGLVGAGLYLALWSLLVARIMRLPDRLEQLSAAGAVAGLAVHAQLEALAFTRGIEVLLALLLAATWTAAPLAENTSERRASATF